MPVYKAPYIRKFSEARDISIGGISISQDHNGSAKDKFQKAFANKVTLPGELPAYFDPR